MANPLIAWRPRRPQSPPAAAMPVPQAALLGTPPQAAVGGTLQNQSSLPSLQQQGALPLILRPGVRPIYDWPRQQVEIRAPKPQPHRPNNNPLTILTAVTAVILAIYSFVVLIMGGDDRGRNPFLNPETPALLGAIVSALGSLASYFYDRYSYRRAMQDRAIHYNTLLEEWRDKLETLANRQREVAAEAYPPPDVVAALARRQAAELWSRSPTDDEAFLELRLGNGRASPAYILKAQLQAQQGDDADELVQQAQALINKFSSVPDCAVTLALQTSGPTCIIGPRDQTQRFVRSLVMQLAAYHSPDDLHLVLIFPEQERDQWAWARWLPHLWNDRRSERLISTSMESTIQMLLKVEQALRQRASTATAGDSADLLPVIVFLFADPELLKSPRSSALHSLLRLLMQDGERANTTAIFVAESPRDVPRDCSTRIVLASPNAILNQERPQPQVMEFRPDFVGVQDAESFARLLAPYRAPLQADSERLGATFTLLQSLQRPRIEQVETDMLWVNSEPSQSLAVPVGRYSDGRVFSLDIHRRGQGPHGLIVGVQGMGKSNFLQSLVCSLALHFHPNDISFVIFDYKARSQTQLLNQLPHQTSIITSLDGARAERALKALEQELQRRERVLKKQKLVDVDEYNLFRRRRSNLAAMPYIVIIADEFAEVIHANYAFGRRLIELISSSDKYGLHLLFSTYEMNFPLLDQVRELTGFRICFHVNRVEDSVRIIGRNDAARPLGRGQAYVQIGTSGVYQPLEKVRVAWSDAPYEASADDELLAHCVPVGLDGVPIAFGGTATMPAQSRSTQVYAVVNYARTIAQRQGIAPRGHVDWLLLDDA